MSGAMLGGRRNQHNDSPSAQGPSERVRQDIMKRSGVELTRIESRGSSPSEDRKEKMEHVTVVPISVNVVSCALVLFGKLPSTYLSCFLPVQRSHDI